MADHGDLASGAAVMGFWILRRAARGVAESLMWYTTFSWSSAVGGRAATFALAVLAAWAMGRSPAAGRPGVG